MVQDEIRAGLNIVRPLTVGGATSMHCGCSAPPLPWWKERYFDYDAARNALHLPEDFEVKTWSR